MTSLQLYTAPQALAEIPQRDHEIAKALNTGLYCQTSLDEAFEIMQGNIAKAYILAKYEMPPSGELTLLTDETMKMFKERFGSIRNNEISICFSRGLRGDYGDFMGLSYPTFSKWAFSYMKEQSRIKLLTPMEEKKEPTLQQRFETAKNLALTAFDKFIEGRSIELEGATVYRFLAGLKVIQYSEDEQNDFMIGATNEVINRKRLEKTTTLDKNVRNQIEKQLDDVTLLKEKIKLIAQHNGLVAYLEILQFESVTPKADLLNSINQQAKQYLK